MTEEAAPVIDEEKERLFEFLYIAPVGLIQFDGQGNVLLANPRIAQLFNRFAPGGYFQNLFTFLDDFLPDLKAEIVSFPKASGQIMENRRYRLLAPDGQVDAELWFDITIMKQSEAIYIASLNNVTEQVRTAQENHINSQKLSVISDSIKDHVVCTVDVVGMVDTWNRSGEVVMGMTKVATLNQPLDQLIRLESITLPDLLSKAARKGTSSCSVTYEDRHGKTQQGNLSCFVFTDLNGDKAGFNMILSSTTH